jgi:hypothetical protein
LQKQVDGIATIEEFGKKQDLNQAQLRSVLEAYAQDYNPTVTGVANAFTRAAQTQEESEDRFHMQAVGSEVLKVYLN